MLSIQWSCFIERNSPSFIEIAKRARYNERNILNILLTIDLKVKPSSSVILDKLNTPLQLKVSVYVLNKPIIKQSQTPSK